MLGSNGNVVESLTHVSAFIGGTVVGIATALLVLRLVMRERKRGHDDES